jgi:RHS repeat-associated protein
VSGTNFVIKNYEKSTTGVKLPLNRFTGKELDEETGFYYYGARYLNPKTSLWISADPAVGEYIPSAPANDEARKRNGNLPGMGGVFNYVNFHVYHYAGNNPLKFTDPDGNAVFVPILIAIAKTGLMGAGVSGAIDIAKQALSSLLSPEGFKLDIKETGAAIAGGFIAGAITGGTGVGVSLLKPLAAKGGAFIAGNAIAGATGSTVATIIDNTSHGRPASENLKENAVIGTIAGTISGAGTKIVSAVFRPRVPY